MSLRVQAAPELTGKRIDDYVFSYSDFLGAGNFSKCYRAIHTKTNRQFAIKIVELNSLKSKKLQELLYFQIQILKQISHPNILRIEEVLTSNRNCYIVTEICAQGDLESRITKGPQMTEIQIQQVIADVYKGLRYLDSKKIIHRDLKIANIFVSDGVSKIADFGFAKHCNSKFKDDNIGSPLYMAPEGMLQSLYGPKTDVWSFGVMIYQLYHKRTPFHHCRSQKQLQVEVLKPMKASQFKADLPAGVIDLVIDCMQISQPKRPTIQQLMKHQFLRKAVQERQIQLNGDLQPKTINVPVVTTINTPVAKTISTPVANATRNRIHQRHQNRDQSVNKLRAVYSVPKELNRRTDSSPKRITFNFNTNTTKNITQNSILELPSNQHFAMTMTPRQQSLIEHQNQLNNRMALRQQIVRAPKTRQTAVMMPRERSYQPQKDNSPVKSPLYLFANNQNPKPTSRLFINGIITFKQSVVLLHYCRLLFKYEQCFKQLIGLLKQRDREHYSLLGNFLLVCLQQLYSQITEHRIIYGQNQAIVRQKKLFEVISQYRKKYRLQLDKECLVQKTVQMTLQTVASSSYSMHASLWIHQDSNQINIVVAQLLLIIYASSLFLSGCLRKGSYQSINQFTSIQAVLNKSRDQFSFENYRTCKERLLSRIQ